ncbi:MAG TPA: CYTH domain-containing protein [Candidatus Bathyarchaeia archaeon]|nr:CYTH domain-containing protein [Candidatus Bathyarchaeia archaeon]
MPSKEEEEIATVLIIRTNAERILADLANLQSILDFQLRHLPRKIIRDTYYDSPDYLLRRKRANLRLREIGGQWFLSAKLGGKLNRGGIISRRDPEIPWSRAALQQIALELGLRLPDTDFVAESPSSMPRTEMERMGLQVVQERETRREGSNVMQGEKLIAELALDKVTFRFKSVQVQLYEIEIELKSGDKTDLRKLESIRNRVASMYRGSLSRWSHGKFVTGRAIEKLLEDGRLQALLDNEGLKPEAVKTIQRVLQSKNLWK